MRHFLRVDGPIAVGPSLGAVSYVETGETLDLDERDPVQAGVADDISRHSSGWVEVDDDGGALPANTDRSQPDARRHRFVSATPEVIDVSVVPPASEQGFPPSGIGEQPPPTEHLDESV